jgi:hypothetical protein
VHRPAFAVTFVAMPGVDGIRNFRALLKAALRHYGLRAIEAHELHAREPQDEPQPGRSCMSKFSERVQAQREEQREKQKDSGIFKVADFPSGKELLLTVRYLDEQVEMFGKQVDLLNFVETGRQLQLNWTTSQWLIDNLGDDPEDWPGRQVVLHLAEYEYNREKKLGIRLKLPADDQPAASKPAPAPTAAAPKPDRKADLDDEIPFTIGARANAQSLPRYRRC